MKKLVISGSAKLQPEVIKWKKYWEKRGYQILDYPQALNPDNYVQEYAHVHPFFHQQLELSDIQFIMNEDKNGITGYIGYASFAEMNYGIIRKINHHQPLEIILLKLPDPSLNCFEEIQLWLELGWIKILTDTEYYPGF